MLVQSSWQTPSSQAWKVSSITFKRKVQLSAMSLVLRKMVWTHTGARRAQRYHREREGSQAEDTRGLWISRIIPRPLHSDLLPQGLPSQSDENPHALLHWTYIFSISVLPCSLLWAGCCFCSLGGCQPSPRLLHSNYLNNGVILSPPTILFLFPWTTVASCFSSTLI